MKHFIRMQSWLLNVKRILTLVLRLSSSVQGAAKASPRQRLMSIASSLCILCTLKECVAPDLCTFSSVCRFRLCWRKCCSRAWMFVAVVSCTEVPKILFYIMKACGGLEKRLEALGSD
jgi:hypothetical protein